MKTPELKIMFDDFDFEGNLIVYEEAPNGEITDLGKLGFVWDALNTRILCKFEGFKEGIQFRYEKPVKRTNVGRKHNKATSFSSS